MIHTSKRQQILCAYYLWPWLGPPLAKLRYVLYFRFCGWRHVRVFTRQGAALDGEESNVYGCFVSNMKFGTYMTLQLYGDNSWSELLCFSTSGRAQTMLNVPCSINRSRWCRGKPSAAICLASSYTLAQKTWFMSSIVDIMLFVKQPTCDNDKSMISLHFAA